MRSISRREVLGTVVGGTTALAICTNPFGECNDDYDLSLKRAYPPSDQERKIVPVRFAELTSAEKEFLEPALNEELIQLCSLNSPSFTFLTRVDDVVDDVLDEQPSLMGGAPHAFLQKEEQLYSIALGAFGNQISFGYGDP